MAQSDPRRRRHDADVFHKECNSANSAKLWKRFSTDGRKGTGPLQSLLAPASSNWIRKYVDIQYKIAGKYSSFSVPGVLEVQIENFKNPVTGAEQETEIHLPKGFIWKVAQAAKTKVMRIVSPNITFDDSGKNAFFCDKLEFKGP